MPDKWKEYAVTVEKKISSKMYAEAQLKQTYTWHRKNRPIQELQKLRVRPGRTQELTVTNRCS